MNSAQLAISQLEAAVAEVALAGDGLEFDDAVVTRGKGVADSADELLAPLAAQKAEFAMAEDFEEAGLCKKVGLELEDALRAFKASWETYETAFSDPETCDPAAIPRDKLPEMIAQLVKLKSEAAMVEDFERAAELKKRSMLFEERLAAFKAADAEVANKRNRIDQIGSEIDRLKQEKVAAAMNEEYDRAAEIKDTISSLEAELGVLNAGGSLADGAKAAQRKLDDIAEADSRTGSFIMEAPKPATPAPKAASSLAPKAASSLAPKAASTFSPKAASPAPKAAAFQPLSLSDIPQFGPGDIQSGFLDKKGAKRRNWKTRWFVAKMGLIRYFEDATATKELGQISVSGCMCFDEQKPHGDNSMGFGIINPKRTFVLSTTNEREFDCWKAAMIAQGAIWGNKPGPPTPAIFTSASSAPSAEEERAAASAKKRQKYLDEDDRLASFRLESEGGHATAVWPHTSPTPEACARAGLFFQPHEDKPDRCRCFACPAALYSWEPSDEPLAAHKMIKPNCPFLATIS